MRRLPIAVIFGTRPEAIKLAPVIKQLSQYPDQARAVVCVTAQHREMLDQVLGLFDIVPDYDLNVMRPDQTPAEVVGRVLQEVGHVLSKEKPGVALVQGDTTTTFAAALSAFYQRIKVGHVEAGLRTFNKYHPYPEEINRTLTTVLADFHFAPTTTAKQNLLREGIPEAKIFVTGNTVIDALFQIIAKGIYHFEDERLASLDGQIILVTAHRRENFGQPLIEICLALKELAERYPQSTIVYPVHLNPHVQETVYPILGDTQNIYLTEPLEYEPFVHLMNKSILILTDSGGIQEEAPSLGKPVLVLRQVTERPEAVEAGTVRLVGTNKEAIVKEAATLLDDQREYERIATKANPYGDGTASEKIVRILLEQLAN
jgi:UDP-N-acetylglucosamine 2-epimerase (non-hydrolysing)